MNRIGVVSLLSLLLLAACAVRQPEPLPAPREHAGIYYEENLPAAKSTQIQITGLQQTPTDDGKHVVLTGTLVNQGTKATSQLSIRVSGLDEQNHEVQSIYAVPRSEHLAAGGGMTTFTTTVDNLPEVKSYHVEAIAK